MAAAEGVIGILHGELHWRRSAGLEGFRLFKTVAELAAHHVATHELLETAHLDSCWIWIRIRIIVGIYVDQLDDPIGISSGGGDMQIDLDRPDDGGILFQLGGLKHEDVGALAGETLIGHHVLRRHADGDFINKWYRLGRIADIFVMSIG